MFELDNGENHEENHMENDGENDGGIDREIESLGGHVHAKNLTRLGLTSNYTR
jgi:hypothetical protein